MQIMDACIAGIGESRCDKVPERSALQLQSDATRAALDERPHLMTRLTQVQPAAGHIGLRVNANISVPFDVVGLPIISWRCKCE